MNPADWVPIVGAMRAGGYYDRIMAGGPELDRVKDYLRAFAGERNPTCVDSTMNPKYPCFPGLRHAPFHDDAFGPAATLERAWDVIREEAFALGEADELDYAIASKPLRSLRRPWTYLKRRAPPRAWTVYPFWYMGVDVEKVTRRCPKTMEVISSLPGLCVEYPWGDALFSVQGPRSSLRAHCSVDNLRMRCHLALRIPPGTGIRVGTQTRTWSEGRCLLFEDAFEHEVWNRSDERRVVLIVDFWHPDLTPVEARALTAGFLKREVRQLFAAQRISVTNSPGTYMPHLEQEMREQEGCALLREFWDA
jgi:hypothetical protein